MFIWSTKTRCHDCELMSWRLAVIASGKQFMACGVGATAKALQTLWIIPWDQTKCKTRSRCYPACRGLDSHRFGELLQGKPEHKIQAGKPSSNDTTHTRIGKHYIGNAASALATFKSPTPFSRCRRNVSLSLHNSVTAKRLQFVQTAITTTDWLHHVP